jgi:hypothetical protein
MPTLKTQSDYEREIDRVLAEVERLDRSIEAHQTETRRSRERTESVLSRLKSQ